MSSFFGTQEGDFSLEISSIVARTKAPEHSATYVLNPAEKDSHVVEIWDEDEFAAEGAPRFMRSIVRKGIWVTMNLASWCMGVQANANEVPFPLLGAYFLGLEEWVCWYAVRRQAVSVVGKRSMSESK